MAGLIDNGNYYDNMWNSVVAQARFMNSNSQSMSNIFGCNFAAPCLNPQMFSQNFMFPNMQFTPFSFTPTITDNSTANNNKSDAERRKEDLKKREEAIKKREEEAAFVKEKEQEISKTKELIEFQQKRINSVKKAQVSDKKTVIRQSKLADPEFNKDGTIKKTSKQKTTKSFGEKAMAWLVSGGEALKNMGKAIIAWDDEKGRPDWGKLAVNVGVAAALIGCTFLPVVGPAIGTALLYGGLASGAIGVGHGIYKYAKTDNPEEEEQARQEAISGGITGLLSAIGLRGVGQGAQAASQATARTGLIGKTVQYCSQFFRDLTVNTVRATGEAMKADKALMAAQTGGAISRFFKAAGSKISTAWENMTSWSAKYDKQFDKMKAEINGKITDIDTKLATETNAAKKALLEEQKTLLQKNLDELNSLSKIKTKVEYDNLRTKNASSEVSEQMQKYSQNASGGYEIGGRQIAPERFEAFQKEMSGIQSKYNKKLGKLIDTKEKVMRTYASKPDAYRTKLDDYTQASIRAKYNTPDKLEDGIKNLTRQLTGNETKITETTEQISHTRKASKLTKLQQKLDNLMKQKANVENELSVCSSIKFKHWYKPSTWRKNDYQMAIGGENGGMGVFFGGIGNTLKQPIAAGAAGYGQWARDFSYPELNPEWIQMTPEQTEETLKQLEAQKAQLENGLKEIEKIKTAEEWQQMKAQAEAQAQSEAQALAEAQAQAQAQAESGTGAN